MLAILTFLASGPGGALLGFVINLLSENRQSKQQQADIQRDTRLAELGHLKDYTSAVHKGTSGTLKAITHSIEFWGFKRTYKTYKAFSTMVPSPLSRSISLAFLLLVCTFCGTILLFAFDPIWILSTLNPDQDPVRFNFLIFGWEYTPSKPVVLNTGGAAFYMAASLNFLITTTIVGTSRHFKRK